MWNILGGLSGAKCHWAGWGGGGGLGGDETSSAALASLPRQLISASCWRLAERKRTPGGLWLWKLAAALQPEISGFISGCSRLLETSVMKICARFPVNHQTLVVFRMSLLKRFEEKQHFKPAWAVISALRGDDRNQMGTHQWYRLGIMFKILLICFTRWHLTLFFCYVQWECVRRVGCKQRKHLDRRERLWFNLNVLQACWFKSKSKSGKINKW